MNDRQRNCEQLRRIWEKARHFVGPFGFFGNSGEALLHGALVGFDHFLDHLAADGAGFTGSEVAVVAVLQVDANLPRRSFTY